MYDEFGEFEIVKRDDGVVRPRVSVIMSVLNGQKYLVSSISSILNQSFSDFEFVIVNDGSSDETSETLQRFLRQDKRIVVVNNRENIGLTKSLIRGIRVSRGTYIARQDADDESAPDRLQHQLEFIPKYDFVCCRTKINNKKNSPKPISVIFYRQIILFKNIFYHGTFVFSRTLYDAIGGYNPLFKFSQDYDFVTRVIESRYKIKYLMEILYFSRKCEESISRKFLNEQNSFARIVKEKQRVFWRIS